jgi:hypothetical protein
MKSGVLRTSLDLARIPDVRNALLKIKNSEENEDPGVNCTPEAPE